MYQVTKDQVIEMTNTEKRNDFLKSYEDWGVAHSDEYTSEIYYECGLPNGAKIIACKEKILKKGKYNNHDVINYYLHKDVSGRTFRCLRVSTNTIVEELKELRKQYVRKE